MALHGPLNRRGALRAALASGAAGLLLPLAPPAQAHEAPGPGERGLAAAVEHLTPGPARRQAVRADGFTVVGHTDLGGGGLNADVWAHRGHAYVGVWSGPCPATGVKVADIGRPSAPRVVSRLQNPPGTSAEDVVVRSVATREFRGDLAAVGIQACGGASSATFRGLEFWDVTAPARPRLLSRWRSPADGCHEIDLTVSRSRVLAACAVPFAEQVDGSDEVAVVDATDPARPVQASGFALGRDTGIDPASGAQNTGCFPASFAHSVRFADRGRTLYASYWDAGALRLDVEQKGRRLALVGRVDIAPPDEDGDVHSVAPARGGRLLVVNPEDFSPVDAGCGAHGAWGEAHVVAQRRDGVQHLSTFSTPNSRSQRTDGFYSVHNTEIARHDQAFSSWYSDGVVWWSLVDPRAPRLRGQFVPPATADPTGTFPPVPLVWGVHLDRRSDLVLASDINSGLWLLRPNGLGHL